MVEVVAEVVAEAVVEEGSGEEVAEAVAEAEAEEPGDEGAKADNLRQYARPRTKSMNTSTHNAHPMFAS